MKVNKGTLFGIIAMIIGASGLGFGIYSVINFQMIEGPQGPPGQDALGGIQVGILDPDYGEEVFGTITIRALIAGSKNYIISILRNDTQIGTSLPYEWDTSIISDGWWNITVKATDVLTNNFSSDEVIVNVKNIDKGFICSSEQEINDVLDEFGAGTVTITLENTIVLTSPIVLNEGGNYTIKRMNSVTVRVSDNTAFEITNVLSCNIYDLTIDASTITSDDTPIIHINEVNDIQVQIVGVSIFGDSDKKSYGIYIQSDNVLIRNCVFSLLYRGISLHSDHANIYNNAFYNCFYGIWVSFGDYNTISYNYLDGNGIWIGYGYYNSIDNNIIIRAVGIDIFDSYHTSITQNYIEKCGPGIWLEGYSHTAYYTMISKNVICNCVNGIYMEGGFDFTSIINNTFIQNISNHIIWEGFWEGIIIIGNTYYLPDYGPVIP